MGTKDEIMRHETLYRRILLNFKSRHLQITQSVDQSAPLEVLVGHAVPISHGDYMILFAVGPDSKLGYDIGEGEALFGFQTGTFLHEASVVELYAVGPNSMPKFHKALVNHPAVLAFVGNHSPSRPGYALIFLR